MTFFRLSRALVLRSALAVLLLPSTAAASHIQYFGYVVGAEQDSWLDGTASYANWSWLSYEFNQPPGFLANRLTALAQRNMKATIDLSKLFWNPTGGFTTLLPNYVQRWNEWKAAHDTWLRNGVIVSLSVRDEPFLFRVRMDQYEVVAQMVRNDFPNVKILLVEAAGAVMCQVPAPCWFDAYKAQLTTVDWVAAVRYAIDPTTDSLFQSAMSKLKSSYPGRRTAYSADGYYGNAHKSAGIHRITDMRAIMTKWHDAAEADPDAVLIGTFIFAPSSEGLSSKFFPTSVLQEHYRVGRLVTGRARSQLSLPVGRFEGLVGSAIKGWACDPDKAWREPVTVEIHIEGALPIVFPADETSQFFPQCRSGEAHRFSLPFSIEYYGRRVDVYARDLDAGVVQLPSDCPDSPSCFFYPNDWAPIGAFEGITPSGVAGGWTCDPDVPGRSIRVSVSAGDWNPQPVGTFMANLASEPEINDQCGGGTAHRFSVQLPAWTKGTFVMIHGVDTMSGSQFLPATPESGCPAVGYCVW